MDEVIDDGGDGELPSDQHPLNDQKQSLQKDNNDKNSSGIDNSHSAYIHDSPNESSTNKNQVHTAQQPQDGKSKDDDNISQDKVNSQLDQLDSNANDEDWGYMSKNKESGDPYEFCRGSWVTLWIGVITGQAL